AWYMPPPRFRKKTLALGHAASTVGPSMRGASALGASAAGVESSPPHPASASASPRARAVAAREAICMPHPTLSAGFDPGLEGQPQPPEHVEPAVRVGVDRGAACIRRQPVVLAVEAEPHEEPRRDRLVDGAADARHHAAAREAAHVLTGQRALGLVQHPE